MCHYAAQALGRDLTTFKWRDEPEPELKKACAAKANNAI